MHVDEIIGTQVRTRREELNRSQANLGADLGHWLGKPWSRQIVSLAEQGKRAFTAVELFALADCLGTTVLELLKPPADVPEVDMPSGATLPSWSLIGFDSADDHSMMVDVVSILRMIREAHQGARISIRSASQMVEMLLQRVTPKGVTKYAEGEEPEWVKQALEQPVPVPVEESAEKRLRRHDERNRS